MHTTESLLKWLQNALYTISSKSVYSSNLSLRWHTIYNIIYGINRCFLISCISTALTLLVHSAMLTTFTLVTSNLSWNIFSHLFYIQGSFLLFLTLSLSQELQINTFQFNVLLFVRTNSCKFLFVILSKLITYVRSHFHNS